MAWVNADAVGPEDRLQSSRERRQDRQTQSRSIKMRLLQTGGVQCVE
jgi:hypothetical protein